MRLYMVRRTRSFIIQNYAETASTNGRYHAGSLSAPRTSGIRVIRGALQKAFQMAAFIAVHERTQ